MHVNKFDINLFLILKYCNALFFMRWSYKVRAFLHIKHLGQGDNQLDIFKMSFIHYYKM
jgi:hypothetical protein